MFRDLAVEQLEQGDIEQRSQPAPPLLQAQPGRGDQKKFHILLQAQPGRGVLIKPNITTLSKYSKQILLHTQQIFLKSITITPSLPALLA